ncbi:MAG: SDR family oxidoreductase [Bacteroidales bacterium]|nr:SDR family oxidoreductase [Bacteroidales bacterium]
MSKPETKLSNQRILVTGGAGFIGSNLIEYFLQNNQVVCLDNLSTGFYKNIEELVENPNFTFIEGDIRDLEVCKKAVKGCDYVFHEAALGSVPRSINDPIATNASNIDGFLNMLIVARDEKVKRFIYAASSSTYGDSKELPKVEHRIGRPLSPYAITKYVNELYAHVFTQLYGLETIGLRYFNVFGKRQSPDGAYAAVIPLWAKMLLNHERPVINGDGSYSRDFTYIENVIQANELSAINPWQTIHKRLQKYQTEMQMENTPDQIFNIAYGGNTTLIDLFTALRDNLAKYDQTLAHIEPIYGPYRNGDIPHSHASIKKASTILKYHPAINARKGFELVSGWYFENK